MQGMRHTPASVLVPGGLVLLGAATLAWNTFSLLPAGMSLLDIVDPREDETRQILLHYTLLPRMFVAVMAGAALGLAGSILQRVLRNPLAEPATLGVSGGAYLALTIATLWFPDLAAAAPEWVAFAGTGCALAAVLGLAWRNGLAPATVTLAGMIISLYCGAASSILMLFNHDFLTGIYLWGAGYLDQQDWSGVVFLEPRLAIVGLAAIVVLRPLSLLALGDANVRSLGLNLRGFRLVALTIAAALIAVVTAAIGVIGFIGLAAPALARTCGARRMSAEVLWSTVLGALLLFGTDQCVQALPVTYRIFPTGAVTALMAAPLMLVLAPKLKSIVVPIASAGAAAGRIDKTLPALALAVVGLAILFMLSIHVGRGLSGWYLASGIADRDLIALRLTRSAAAFCGGAMLAVAGAVLQRMTGNPLGSPEALGVSSGAMLGVIAITLSATTVARPLQIGAATMGAGIVLLAIMMLARKGGYQGHRLLLIGITLSSISGFVMTVVMAAQDPRLEQLLAWMSGSTYAVQPSEAMVAAIILAMGLIVTWSLRRWLEILPLGADAARNLGAPMRPATLTLLSFSATMTAAATILVGPLSFAGLMGPHLARLAGFRRAVAHACASALIGGAILLIAEWAGRNLIFPYQIPAGLLATVVGGPFLLVLIGKHS